MSFDQSKAQEIRDGVIINDAAGVFSGSGSPVGSQAPLGSKYSDKDTGESWFKVGSGANDWVRFPVNLVTSSQKPTYLANGEVDTITFYRSATQTVANRVALVTMAYDGSLNPTSETWQIFDESNGTTVVKTITFTHTFTGVDLTNTSISVS